MKKVLNKRIIIYLLASLLLITFVISMSPLPMQNDTFWSIKVGEEIIQRGIETIDVFSIHTGLKYIAHHFLTDAMIYIVYSFFGLYGLYILEVVLAAIMAGLLYYLNYNICKNKWISYIMVFIQMFLLSGFIAVRAQMVSYIIFITEMIILEKLIKQEKNRYYIYLLILPVILVNFHMGTVPFYFVILFVYLISMLRINIFKFSSVEITDKSKFKKLLIIMIIGGFTIFLNPYFINGFTYFLKTLSNSYINSNIQEFQPFSLNYENSIITLIYMFLIILVMIIYNKKINIKDALLIFGTIFMSFLAIRYISLMVIASSVILKYVIEIIKEIDLKITESDRKTVKVMYILIVFTLLISSMNIITTNIGKDEFIPESMYPIKATQYLKENMKSTDVIFNKYEWGSYLMLNNIKVFIDSRCDLYTKEYNKTTVAEDYTKIQKASVDYEKLINKYHINLFIISPEIPLYTLLVNSNEYKIIYEDKTAVIFRKN